MDMRPSFPNQFIIVRTFLPFWFEAVGQENVFYLHIKVTEFCVPTWGFPVECALAQDHLFFFCFVLFFLFFFCFVFFTLLVLAL